MTKGTLPPDQFAEFARSVGRSTDDVLKRNEADELARAKARLQQLGSASPKPQKNIRVAAVFALGAVASAAVVLLWIRPSGDTVTAVQPNDVVLVRYSEQQGSSSLPIGAWLQPVSEAHVEFSTGARWHLDAGSGFRVLSANASRVEGYLDHGQLSVTPRVGQSSNMLLGPFAVEASGQFTAQWNPHAKVFMVTVTSGLANVTGPKLDQGRVLRAGENLTVSWNEQIGDWHLGDWHLGDRHRGDEQPRAAVVRADGLPAVRTDHPASGRTNVSPPTSISAAREPTCDAVEWSAVSTSADAAQLMDFARLCRRQRNTRLAEQAYHQIREQSVDPQQRSAATFELARLSASGEPAEARSLFNEYMTHTDAPLRQEALGRLIELTEGSERSRLSLQYLEMFPGGPYARIARQYAQ